MKRLLHIGLLFVGAMLLCTGVVMKSQRLTRSEMKIALTPLLVIPGNNILPEPRFWNIKIPVTRAWKKLETRFGKPDYLLAVVRNGKIIECFSNTGINAQVTADGMRLVSRAVRRQPYGFSSDCSNNACLAFSASAATDLTVVLNTTTRQLDFSEDVICMPDWHVSMKDQLVGRALDDSFWTSWKAPVLMGSLIVLTGSTLLAKNRYASSRSA